MDNDKAFAAYALILVSGIGSVITASVLAGFASLPSLAVFVEHVAMSLAIRAAYKSFGGFDVSDWSVVADATGDAFADSDAMLSTGTTADATS